MIATRICIYSALVAVPCLAQSAENPPAGSVASTRRPKPATSDFKELRFPRDQDYVVATVDAEPITLGDLVRHIDERHYPGFAAFLAGPEGNGSAGGARLLQSDLIAPWVRNLADIRALSAEAGPLDDAETAELEGSLAAALKEAFESYLASYVEDLRQRGLPTNLSQTRINRLLADFQMRRGTATEMQGWLDYLRPLRDWPRQELRDFFQDNARVFGGGVTLAHILVQHRDAGTGILLDARTRAGAKARLMEIQSRLRDGADFAETARLFSEDSKTAPTGGVFRNVQRFDYRLPPGICRVAWRMRDGEISDVVETRYGWHILKRVEHVQRRFMLFTDAAMDSVRLSKQRLEQENLLFAVREKHDVRLQY